MPFSDKRQVENYKKFFKKVRSQNCERLEGDLEGKRERMSPGSSRSHLTRVKQVTEAQCRDQRATPLGASDGRTVAMDSPGSAELPSPPGDTSPAAENLGSDSHRSLRAKKVGYSALTRIPGLSFPAVGCPGKVLCEQIPRPTVLSYRCPG